MSSGILRWLKWSGDSSWHLRFGSTGPALCDTTVQNGARIRWLSEGPPAKRCVHCAEVIRLRVGLDKSA